MINKYIKIQIIAWVSVIILLAAYICYTSHLGKLTNSPYSGVYEFFHTPTWKNFRRLYGDIVASPWGNILLQFFFMTIPVPKSSMIMYLELLLLKVSMYSLSVQMIAGDPVYSPNVETSSSKSNRVSSIVVVSIAIVVVLFTHLVTSLHTDDNRYVDELTFKRNLKEELYS